MVPPLRRSAVVFALALCALLPSVGCSSGGNYAIIPIVSRQPQPAVESGNLIVRLVVLGTSNATASRGRSAHTTTRDRHPLFISAATLGVKLVFSGTASSTQVINVAPGAGACGGSNASPRTCSIQAGLPVGTYTIVATSYDTAPSSGAIPVAAHELATGSVASVAIVAGQSNVVTIYLGGLITTYTAPTAFISVPGDGATHQVAFVLAPTDYANEQIITGTNDPYTNPITLTLTESGGAGHESVLKNGTNVGSTATISKSTDTVQLTYDGAGTTGYSGSLAITASGVATQTVIISPMYLVPASYAVGRTVNFTSSGQTSIVAIAEAHAPNTVTYTAPATGCSGIASAGAASGSGASANVVLTANTSASTSGCAFTITDSTGTSTSVPISITNTLTNATLAIPARLQSFAIPTATSGVESVTIGPDGNSWFTEPNNQKIGRFDVSGTITEYNAGLTAGLQVSKIAAGPDGKLYFIETVSPYHIGRMTTAGTITESFVATSSGAAEGIAAGPDGNMWITQYNTGTSIGYISRVTLTGTVTVFTAPSGVKPGEITAGPDGKMWFTDQNGSVCSITVGGYAVCYSTGISSGATPLAIATGPDGDLWFTEYNRYAIAKIDPTSHTVTEYAVLFANADPGSIISGPDGALWFGEVGGGGDLGRITTAGVITQYSTSSSVYGLTVGLDGTLVLALPNSNSLARFIQQ